MSRTRFVAEKKAVGITFAEFDFVYFEEVASETVERVETFVCTGGVSSLMLSELAFLEDLSPEQFNEDHLKLFRNFMSAAIGDNRRYHRFLTLMNNYGSDDLLWLVIQDLVEQFSARPTQPPASSRGSHGAGGTTGTVALSPEQAAAMHPLVVNRPTYTAQDFSL